jgi:hypothetical protein
MIQREREMEGDEFKDKEAFVTQAYKDQLAEIRRAEEEERLRNGESRSQTNIVNTSLDSVRGRKEKENPVNNWYDPYVSEDAGGVGTTTSGSCSCR